MDLISRSSPPVSTIARISCGFSQYDVTAERSTLGSDAPNLAQANWIFPQPKKLVGTARWPSSMELLIGPIPCQYSPQFRLENASNFIHR